MDGRASWYTPSHTLKYELLSVSSGIALELPVVSDIKKNKTPAGNGMTFTNRRLTSLRVLTYII